MDFLSCRENASFIEHFSQSGEERHENNISPFIVAYLTLELRNRVYPSLPFEFVGFGDILEEQHAYFGICMLVWFSDR